MPFYSKISRVFSVTELSLQEFTMTHVPKTCPFIVNSAEHSPWQSFSLQEFTMTYVPKNMPFYSKFSRVFSVTELFAARIYNDTCSKNMSFYRNQAVVLECSRMFWNVFPFSWDFYSYFPSFNKNWCLIFSCEDEKSDTFSTFFMWGRKSVDTFSTFFMWGRKSVDTFSTFFMWGRKSVDTFSTFSCEDEKVSTLFQLFSCEDEKVSTLFQLFHVKTKKCRHFFNFFMWGR